MDPLEEFDHLIIFSCTKAKFKSVCSLKDTHYVDWLDGLASLLIDSLVERVSSVKCLNIPLRSKVHLSAIGLKLNASMLYSPVIRGPRSGTDAGKQFRDFWGDKSEIRHIDGDLFECVIWDSSKDITSQIIDYVFLRKSGFACESNSKLWYQVSSTQLNGVLRSPPPPDASLRLPIRASILHMIRSLDQFNSILCGFNKHLPLNVMGVQAVSAEFRGTSVFEPVVIVRESNSKKSKSSIQSPWHNIHHTLRPIYAMINIETSSKWPRDNYQAFLHMKRLFLLRIKELLVHIGVPSRVVASGMLDVFMNGVVLRVSFCQPVELTLLRKSLGLNKPISLNTSCVSTGEPEVLGKWLTFYERLPLMTSQLVSISRSHLHTFPEACRLAKRWLSAHGFPVIQCPDLCTEPLGLNPQSVRLGDADLGASHCRLSEIAVELMIVHAGGFTPAVQTPSYCAGLPGSTEDTFSSASPLATFLRFLRLLYTFNWADDILLVDLNEGFSEKEGKEKASAAVTTFKITPRDRLPVMVIATPLDPSGTHWTHDGPSLEGLQRLQALAMHSHELLRAMLVAGAELSDLKAIFRPDLSQMDVLIKLRPSVYKTRILEAIDIEAPSWALKKPSLVNAKAVVKAPAATKVADPVTVDLPHPGASYWPNGYLCDPVTWILREIQTRFVKWDLFEYMWDRHSGRWIGLRIKDLSKCARLCELKSFTESSLLSAGGFACLRESPPGSMALAVDIQLALKMLHFWASEMVQSVRIQHPHHFKLPGVEVKAPTTAVVPLVNAPSKESQSEHSGCKKAKQGDEIGTAAGKSSTRKRALKRRQMAKHAINCL